MSQPMGIIIFSVFMQASFIQVLYACFLHLRERLCAHSVRRIESVQRVFNPDLEVVNIPRSGYIIMGSTVIIKSLVWLAYRSFQNSSVKALAQDAQNDVVFNLFSILFPLAGTLVGWPPADAAGGIILSLYSTCDQAILERC